LEAAAGKSLDQLRLSGRPAFNGIYVSQMLRAGVKEDNADQDGNKARPKIVQLGIAQGGIYRRLRNA
jgi:hypothetical protein